MTTLTLSDIRAFDASDPLAQVRERFDLPADTFYFAGNSLGALPKTIPQRLQKLALREWGQGLVRSWTRHDWFELPQTVGDKLARLIGARAGEVIVCDSTSVNLYKLAMAALRLRPKRNKIITTSDNFPTGLYILQGLTATLNRDIELKILDPNEFLNAVDGNTALVTLTQVDYRTGYLHDMEEVTRRAHQNGALTLWDLSHSCGAMPLDLDACEVDMATGCGYKYLNAGPGAPAFVYVRKDLQAQLEQPLTGWMGHAEPFAMSEQYEPAPDLRRLLCGTHLVPGLVCLDEALDIFADIDMEEVAQKSAKLGESFIRLMEQRCNQHGFILASPVASGQRGSQVCFRHEHAYPIAQALIERKVICDFRAPDIVRFGLTPLYLRHADIWAAVDALASVMEKQEWKQGRFNELAAVT
ncbi:MAG: kynureninase [Gammaproteobacteria bacterium]|nr:kynureninase [Gammaproteobacteria bacterium]